MKKILVVTGFVILLAGCGRGKGDGQTSDQQVMKLGSEIQILQQSVEIQSKAIKTLENEVAQLKTQLSEGGLGEKSIEGLKARVDMLEADANGFAK